MDILWSNNNTKYILKNKEKPLFHSFIYKLSKTILIFLKLSILEACNPNVAKELEELKQEISKLKKTKKKYLKNLKSGNKNNIKLKTIKPSMNSLIKKSSYNENNNKIKSSKSEKNLKKKKINIEKNTNFDNLNQSALQNLQSSTAALISEKNSIKTLFSSKKIKKKQSSILNSKNYESDQLTDVNKNPIEDNSLDKTIDIPSPLEDNKQPDNKSSDFKQKKSIKHPKDNLIIKNNSKRENKKEKKKKSSFISRCFKKIKSVSGSKKKGAKEVKKTNSLMEQGQMSPKKTMKLSIVTIGGVLTFAIGATLGLIVAPYIAVIFTFLGLSLFFTRGAIEGRYYYKCYKLKKKKNNKKGLKK